MVIQRADSNNGRPGTTAADQGAAPRSCRVELPLNLLDEQDSLLDWVIGFAFDTLQAQHLDLRIVPLVQLQIADCRL
jgi:hypothetical protein